MAQRIGARQLVTLLDGWRAPDTQHSPAYRRLADRIKLLVLDGRLSVGAPLPAERELAARLETSRTTVTGAYNHLRDLGYVQRRQGSGSFTRLPHGGDAELPDRPSQIDFTSAATPASPGLHAATQQALDMFPEYLAGTGYDLRGIPELREAVAARYTDRGLPTAAGNIVVTVGAQHASGLLMRMFGGPGRHILVESPGFPQSFDAARMSGARLVTTPVSADGWDAEDLLRTIRTAKPALAYVMPDFHNPTGACMPADLRTAFTRAAADAGTIVIADETTAELAIDERQQFLPLAAYGPAILLGSVGKTMWGGLRVGWIRADSARVSQILQARPAADLGTPILEQLICTVLLRDYRPVLDDMRLRLRASRDLVVAELGRRFPSWTVPRVRGGHTVWARLDRPVSSQLAIRALENGLRIPPGPRFGLDGAFERFVRVPITFDTDTTLRALDLLETSWHQVLGSSAAPCRKVPDDESLVI
ncbi:MocR-like transcription factor YczR [Spelaeicoccus albus]|uniref:DNA-binding transcriptional MocR family regulator n=1 Tax=Spelaeicoccus albus TaxID=1280376 RepID=A0A7Z0IIX9_9MICO|nr:PLP-dependent aminotransferase family protein [Spelaeicoccus albus]NYI68929.1 DNA-binding transcriptional MocR family regulator [Spelaeicoccus albus]